MTPHHRHDDTTVLLIHGGLWEDGMDANRFWIEPGISAGLERQGFTVLVPNRLYHPPSWQAEVEHLAPVLPSHPVSVVAGSNGCSTAVRLALAFPEQIATLLLAWPATAGDPAVDSRAAIGLAGLGASQQNVRTLLDGETLRGVADDELAMLDMPIAVLPSFPENVFHQRQTVDALLRVLTDAEELPGCPEPPRPDFSPHRAQFLASLAKAISR